MEAFQEQCLVYLVPVPVKNASDQERGIGIWSRGSCVSIQNSQGKGSMREKISK